VEAVIRQKPRACSRELMDTYYTSEFTFNEYPHKSFWSPGFTEQDLKMAYAALDSSTEDVSQLLFLNIPFCKKQCLFCICHTVITQDYPRVQQYLRALWKEIDLFRTYCDAQAVTPDIREVHIGGGSPTLLTEQDFGRLLERIHSIARTEDLGKVSLEVDPRGVTPEKLEFYAAQGVNRLSFGVQDFDPEVQKVIGRVQPAELLEALLVPQLRQRFDGINFDILCGLPRQTAPSFRNTIDTTVAFGPERIMLMFFNFCPEIKAHQSLLKEADMPGLEAKWALFDEAVETLEKNGYIRIGFDHFAKASDDLVQALQSRTLHWNSLGYRSGRCVDMIGLGSGSLSRLTPDYYAQNIYDLEAYERSVMQGRFPVGRGCRLNADDKIRRDVIHSLRCHLSIDMQYFEKKYDIDFSFYFSSELDRLKPCQADGLADISGSLLTITESGRRFTSHICGLFDAFIGKET
jgi:oxygen-independent coproporphyrinogen III oxidase